MNWPRIILKPVVSKLRPLASVIHIALAVIQV